jgi:PKD repeat protein
LAGSGSDLDGDPLTFTWDLNNDGVFETSGQYPTFSAVDRDGPDSQLVVLQVCDDHSACATDTAIVDILNVTPVVEAGADQTVNEGDVVSFSGSFVDRGTDKSEVAPKKCVDPCPPQPSDPGLDTHTIEWDFGDGSTASGALTPTHVYADNGVYTVTLTVTDDDGGMGSDTLTVTVNNVAPTVEAGADQIVNEGDLVSFVAAISDAGSADTHTVLWEFGDGSSASGPTLTHTYADNGVYMVTLTVTDDDGGMGSDTLTVTVNNLAPTVEAGADQMVNEGDLVSFSGSFTDPGSADTHTVLWDFGDGSTASGALTPTHVYADNGVYMVTLTVTDDDGGMGSDTLTVTVNNVAPTVDVGADQIVNEGDLVSFSGSFTDLGSTDTHAIQWDFGDGSTSSGSLTPTHVYADNGVYMVTLTVTDDDGGMGSDTLTVTVNNVAPTTEAGANTTISPTDLFYLMASFTDPGIADTHTATIEWGDGMVESGTVDPTAHTVSGAHDYPNQPGSYTVSVCVSDDDGLSGCDSLIVEVVGGPPGGEPPGQSGDVPPVNPGPPGDQPPGQSGG